MLSAEGEVLYEHAPAGATVVSLPDSRDLWEVLWEHRSVLGGVAHSHPGAGAPVPSSEDLTTFAACEAALGARLDWWIATADQVRCYRHIGPGRLDYGSVEREEPLWLERLRAMSAVGVDPAATKLSLKPKA